MHHISPTNLAKCPRLQSYFCLSCQVSQEEMLPGNLAFIQVSQPYVMMKSIVSNMYAAPGPASCWYWSFFLLQDLLETCQQPLGCSCFGSVFYHFPLKWKSHNPYSWEKKHEQNMQELICNLPSPLLPCVLSSLPTRPLPQTRCLVQKWPLSTASCSGGSVEAQVLKDCRKSWLILRILLLMFDKT